jgi:hypothetical protein
MNIEIAARIVKSNKAYYANAKPIKSKFLKRNAKMKIYETIIRPVVTYSSETWTLTAKDENNLCIFERQILRKIFGPVNIDNIRRIRNNMQKMDQARPTRKLSDWKPMGTRPVGKTRQRWQEDVTEN